MPAPSVGELIAIGTLRRLSWGDDNDAAMRTTHTFTLGSRLNGLANNVERWKKFMLGNLAAVPPEPPRAPPLSLFKGGPDDLSKQVACKAVAAALHDQGCMSLAAAVDLFNDKRLKFLDVVTAHFYPGGDVLVERQHANRVRVELYRSLPLLAVPYRAPNQRGKRPMLLLPDVPSLSDAELKAHLKPVIELKRLQAERASAGAGAALTAADYALLRRAMPSEISAITDALVIKLGGPNVASELGIGAHRAATAAQRLDLLVHTTLPAAQADAHAAATTMLAQRSGLSNANVISALRAATTWQLRAAVEKQSLLRDSRFATHLSLLKLAPNLLDVLRACAREDSNAVFKERGETPVDKILLERDMHGSGGQQLRMQVILNQVLADRDLSVSIGTVNALLKQADIKALAVKHTLNPPKVGKHYCAAEIKSHRQIAHLFSAYCVRLSIDQKANLKSNSDHNTAEGGNRKKFQISSERTYAACPLAHSSLEPLSISIYICL